MNAGIFLIFLRRLLNFTVDSIVNRLRQLRNSFAFNGTRSQMLTYLWRSVY